MESLATAVVFVVVGEVEIVDLVALRVYAHDIPRGKLPGADGRLGRKRHFSRRAEEPHGVAAVEQHGSAVREDVEHALGPASVDEMHLVVPLPPRPIRSPFAGRPCCFGALGRMVACDPHAARGEHFDERKRVFGSRVQHARGRSEIADAVHLAEGALVEMALHHKLHLAGLLEYAPDLRCVLHARLVLGIKLLVDDRDARPLRGRELTLQELNLLLRDECVLPREIPPAIRLAVMTVARVEHDEPHSLARESVVCLRRVLSFVGDIGEELILREVVVVVIAEDMVARPLECGEARFDRTQVLKRFGRRAPEVLEVPAFHNEVDAKLCHLRRKGVHLQEAVAVVAQDTGLDVRRVVAVGDEAKPHHRRSVADIAKRRHCACGGKPLQEPAPRYSVFSHFKLLIRNRDPLFKRVEVYTIPCRNATRFLVWSLPIFEFLARRNGLPISPPLGRCLLS